MTHRWCLSSLFKEKCDAEEIEVETRSKDFLRMAFTPGAPIDILAWITGAGDPERFYFRNKDNTFQTAGWGHARTICGKNPGDVVAQLDQLWRINPDMTVFGGMNFFPDQTNTDEWRGFAPIRFTLPFVEITQKKEGLRIVINHVASEEKPLKVVEQEIVKKLERLEAEPHGKVAKPAPYHPLVRLTPDREAWETIVAKAMAHIRSSNILKIVLARKKVVMREQAWDPATVLQKLAGIKENSYLFLYQISGESAFMGRSPERLFKIENRTISAEAIAGSNPRGHTEKEDKALEHDLLHSPKELGEHRLVSDYVEKQLRAICRTFSGGEKESILKLQNIQHIISQYSGVLKKRVDPFSVLCSFHPTPAVGGYPSGSAQALIKALEPFERGWYAGPIGWMNKDNAEFAVGIRSALVHGTSLHVFGGAGIVSQSTVQDEWLETENKMANFSDLTGCG